MSGGLKLRKEAELLLASLQEEALWVTPKERIDEISKDPSDNKFLECAGEAKADYLITGNIKHFPFKRFHKTKIVNPREFIETTLDAIITAK